MLYQKSMVHVFHSKHAIDTKRHKLYPCPQGVYSLIGEVSAQENWNVRQVVVSAIREGQGCCEFTGVGRGLSSGVPVHSPAVPVVAPQVSGRTS